MDLKFKNDHLVESLETLNYGDLFCPEGCPEELWVKVDVDGTFEDDIKLENNEIMCVQIGYGDIFTFPPDTPVIPIKQATLEYQR